jgi:hypothetical protein
MAVNAPGRIAPVGQGSLIALPSINLGTASGTLSVIELPDTLVASGGPRVGGTLAYTELPDTLVAAGGPRVGGTLATSQANQTLVAAGTVAALGVSGALAITEAPDTLTAAGAVATPAQVHSLYGNGVYGKGLYSRATVWDLAGNLAPSIAFAGDFTILMAGDMPVQVVLSGSLALDLSLHGDLPSQVFLAGSGFVSGPLWADEEPCLPPLWEQSEPCPPPMWTPIPPPMWTVASGAQQWKKQEKVDDVSVWHGAAD